MDKKLLKAKQELQKYTNIWIVIAICSALILAVNKLGYLTKSYADSHFANYMNGFYMGLFIVTIVVSVCYIAKNYKAMKNEKDLMRLYNEMHDERCRQIFDCGRFIVSSCCDCKFHKFLSVCWYHHFNDCIYLYFYYL